MLIHSLATTSPVPQNFCWPVRVSSDRNTKWRLLQCDLSYQKIGCQKYIHSKDLFLRPPRYPGATKIGIDLCVLVGLGCRHFNFFPFFVGGFAASEEEEEESVHVWNGVVSVLEMPIFNLVLEILKLWIQAPDLLISRFTLLKIKLKISGSKLGYNSRSLLSQSIGIYFTNRIKDKNNLSVIYGLLVSLSVINLSIDWQTDKVRKKKYTRFISLVNIT